MDFALRLQNFRAVGAAGAVQAAGPTGITLSSTEVDDDHTGLFATLFMEGGTEPGTFSIESGPSWLSIENVDELHADGTQTEGTDNVTIKVTDADGREFVMASPVTIDVLAAPGDNDSGIGDGDGDIDEGGDFEGEVIQQDTSDGLKITGKSGGTAVFVKDIGPPVAGGIYTMRYSADWSGMNKQGRHAAVGFAFKDGDDFHLVGLRGDGSDPAAMLDSQMHGDFSQPNGFTLTDDGEATNGTKDGPNWVQIEIAENGSTYTFRTSADGETWADEYTDELPTPLAAATDALQFGPGAYFANQDKGVFQLTIELWQVEGIGVGAHRYWRTLVYAVEQGGSRVVDLAEIELRESAGGADETGSGTASASSTNSSFVPANAVDDNPSSVYSSQGNSWTSPIWWKYDFGAAVTKEIVQLAITASGSTGGGGRAPSVALVQFSDDDSVWETAWAFGETGWSNGEERVITPDAPSEDGHFLWRINCSAADGGSSVALGEVELRESDGGADETTNNFAATASSTFGGQHPQLAVDNSGAASFWASGSGAPQWWLYAFGSKKAIMQVAITARNGSPNQSPKDFTIEWSDDGENWTVEWSETGETGWTAGETRVFTKP